MKKNFTLQVTYSNMNFEKCPICHEIPSIPVIPHPELHNCECSNFQKYCLTCFRDEFGLNRRMAYYGLSLPQVCQTCSSGKLNSQILRLRSNSYTVDNDLVAKLDDEFGEIECPRKCGSSLLRCNLQGHLHFECLNSKRFKCDGCNTIFTHKELADHVKKTKACKLVYTCRYCELYKRKFLDDSVFDKHIDKCFSQTEKCELCENSKNVAFMDSHFSKCFKKKLRPLKHELGTLKEEQNHLSRRIEDIIYNIENLQIVAENFTSQKIGQHTKSAVQ